MFESVKDTVRIKLSRKIFPKKLYTIERIDFRLNEPIKMNDGKVSTVSLTNLDYLGSEVLIFSDQRAVEEFKKDLIPDGSYDNVAYAMTQPDKYGMHAIALIHDNILHHFVFATSEMAPEDGDEETDSIANNMSEIESFLDKRRKHH